MEPLISTAIDNLLSANATVTTDFIKVQLEIIYHQTIKFGLTNLELRNIIHFITTTQLITDETKLYIIHNCLYPCEVIGKEVVMEILSKLGTTTIYSPYELTTPKTVQTALCEWLVNAFFLVDIEQIREFDSFWIHLWKYSYLQKWLTYIIVWTANPHNVKQWKIRMIHNIAINLGYSESSGYAVIILKKYQQICGYSAEINDILPTLRFPYRRIIKVQNIRLRNRFFKNTSDILITSTPDTFNMEKLENRMQMLINSLLIDEIKSSQGVKPSIIDKNIDIELLIPKNSTQLIDRWNLMQPSDIVISSELFHPNNKINYYILAFISTKRSPQFVEDYITDYFMRHLSDNEDNFGNAYKSFLAFVKLLLLIYPNISLSLTKTIGNGTQYDVKKSVLMGVLPAILPKSKINIECIQKCIFNIISSNFNTQNLLSQKSLNLSVVTTRLYFDLYFLIFLNSELAADLSSLFHRAGTLGFRRTIETTYNFGDISSSVYYLNLVTSIIDSNELYKSVPGLIIKPNILKSLIMVFDPLLLNSCCKYLTQSKGALSVNIQDKDLIRCHNQLLLDTTNYLWRNKILSSRSLFDISTKFIKQVVDNLYLPDCDKKDKNVFGLPGVPTTGFVFLQAVRRLEGTHGARSHYNTDYTSSGFKKFKSNQEEKGDWLHDIEDFDEFRRVVLKEFTSIDCVKEIAVFLYTFLKSLTSNL